MSGVLWTRSSSHSWPGLARGPAAVDETPPLFRASLVELRGVRLHVVETGIPEAPPVIFLHGFPEQWSTWRSQMSAFARIGFHAIAPDQRGYGLSDKPQATSAYALDALVEDVVELIDSTGYQRAAVVGHDWGGIVAWRLAMQHPERVRRLAVLNAPHPLAFREGLCRNPAQLLRSWYTFFFQLPQLPELMLKNQSWKTTRRIFKTHRLGAYSDADLAEYRSNWLRPGAATAMINWYRAAMQYPADFSGDCHIHVPTLIIWGDHDNYLLPKLAASSLRYCNNGRLVHQEAATHWVHRENPRDINRLLKSFLAIDGGGSVAPNTGKKSTNFEETTLYK